MTVLCSDLSSLSNVLIHEVQSRWSVELDNPIFLPLVDQSRGDISSDICLRLASETRESPGKFIEGIGQVLSERLDGSFSWENNYLNVTWADPSKTLPEDVETFSKLRSRPIKILVPSFWDGVDFSTYLRVIAPGVVQYDLARSLKVPVEIFIGGNSFSDISTRSLIEKLLSQDYYKPFSEEKTCEFLTEELKNPDSESVFTWIHPALLKEDLSARFRDLDGSNARLRMESYSHERFSGLPGLDPNKVLKEWSVESRAALFVYLAGDTIGREIDDVVPQVKEYANRRWLYQSVIERFGGFADGDFESVRADSAETRRLISYSRNLPLALHSAAILGELDVFIDLISTLLRELIAFAQKPEADKSSNISENTQQIMAGAVKVLFDTMNQSELFSRG